jgi:hypothetical protein
MDFQMMVLLVGPTVNLIENGLYTQKYEKE